MKNQAEAKNAGEEPILAEAVAGRLVWGLNGMGGRLLLTPVRLHFVPFIRRADLKTSSTAAKWSAQLHDWPVHPQMLLNLAIQPFTGDIDIPFEKIWRAEASRKNGLLLTCGDPCGNFHTREFAIFEKMWRPSMEKNVVARDRLLARIKQAKQFWLRNF